MTDREGSNQAEPAGITGQKPVMIPNLCQKHQRDLVRKLHMSDRDPWRVAMTVTQIMLFTWTTADVGFHRRTEGHTANFNIVLAEIGCLACRSHDGFARAIRLIRERGMSHAAAVSRNEIVDELWPIQARIDAMEDQLPKEPDVAS